MITRNLIRQHIKKCMQFLLMILYFITVPLIELKYILCFMSIQLIGMESNVSNVIIDKDAIVKDGVVLDGKVTIDGRIYNVVSDDPGIVLLRRIRHKGPGTHYVTQIPEGYSPINFKK